ncbi:MAG: aminoglycoside phosphotransferase family protein, partial [Myxococcota bacterium]|nr:aminoglycoside phosphotransferase family protein [Myxococcota bacterium]
MSGLRDPELPGLAASLDVDGFLERLERSLPECRDELALEEGEIFDVQYKPGTSGLVLYRLKLRERATGRGRRQYLSVRALASGERAQPPSPDALRAYAGASDRALRTPYLELPAQRLVAYAFPLDPVLGSLAGAFDPAVVGRALQALWRERGVRVRRVVPRTLGYTPLARAAVHYEVLSESRDGGVPEVRHLVGKIHGQKPAARLFAGAWALWRAAKLRVRLAPPVGFLGPLDMSLQERVSGERLGDLAGGGTFVKPVRDAARSLATLHGLVVPTTSRRSAAKEAQNVHRWGSVLAALRPDQAPRVEALRDRLAARLEEAARPDATLHGDFHPANVLSDGHHATLIDVDQMAVGDPLLDVGRFLASLRVSSLRVADDPAFLEPAAAAFEAQYLAHRHDDARRLRLFEAACLLTAAATGFRLQRRGWETNALLLLDEAERALERAGGGGPRPADPGARPAERSRSRCALAADPVYMRAALHPHVRAHFGAELGACRVQADRSRPDALPRRYRLAGERDGEPFRAAVQAVSCRGGGGRADREAIDAMRRALESAGGVADLPRPVAWLRELGLLVLEEPRGTRLSALVREGAPPPGLGAGLARGLRALHVLDVVPARERPLEAEAQAVVDRAAGLAPRLPAAPALARAAAQRVRRAAPERAPCLGRLRPGAICWDGGTP